MTVPPLPYSFGEASADKLSWLVELGAAGLSSVRAVPAPVHRRLTALSGTLEDLLTSSAHTPYEQDFVALTLTDPVRPVDAMAALQRRYSHPLTLVWQPSSLPAGDGASYAQRTRGRSDLEVADAFVAHVRGTSTEAERSLLADALVAARLAEDAA
jgi:exonuclease SbcD